MNTYKLLFKKSLLSLLSLSLLTSSLLFPKQSQAIVFPAHTAAYVVGGMLVYGGAAKILDGIIDNYPNHGIIYFAMGIIYLDNSGQEVVNFPTINKQQAEEAKLNQAEFSAYQNERLKLKLLAQSVSKELLKSQHPSEQEAAKLWESHSRYVSKDAFKGAVKIVKFASESETTQN